MKLHQDKNAFRVLLESIHNKTGYRTDVIEKDYYVTLILSELAAKQNAGLPAYFKGGTALYKALKSTNRFSEDIDLSVDIRGCTNAQSKKRLEHATKKFTLLPRDREQCKTNLSEVIAVYTYQPITNFDVNDVLQRFGKLKIEATSFTISEPVTYLEITPMLYDLATIEQKQILENNYDIKPFSIQTITIERIFIDKLFAAEAYVRKCEDSHRAFEAAKHLYDLAVLKGNSQITALLRDQEQMTNLLQIRMLEEQNRKDGIPGIIPKNFLFFDNIANNKNLKIAYETMQRQYVFRDSDRIEYDIVKKTIKDIHMKLIKNSAWSKYEK